MRYMEMIKLLQEKFQIENMSNSYNAKIIDVKPMDEHIDNWHDRTLYIGHASSQSLPDKPVMLIGPEPVHDICSGSSYSLIRSGDLVQVYNCAKDYLMDELRSEAELFELSQAVLNKKSLAHLINMAADVLGNAIILTDGGKKVLAHSAAYEIADPLWAENVERGFLSYEFIQKVRLNKQMKEWDKQGSNAQLITLPGDKQPKLVARIVQNGHVAGSLIMVEHHTKINRSHFIQLPLVGDILFESFSYDSSKGMYKSIHSSVLYNMLDEREMNKSEMLSLSKITFPKSMQVVVAQFTFNTQNHYLKFSLRVDLERLFPDGFSVLYKSYIAILVPDVSLEQKEKLTKLALEESVNIGISWKFDDISQFSRHFYQSVTCIKQSRHFGGSQVCSYTEFAYYDMLINSSAHARLENFCHPALKWLNDYDDNLYITLKKYLDCSKNACQTSDALFIHRNTLNYRIKRIKELTSLDLDDPNTVQCLMDSFRIEKFLNLMKGKS
ncbi:MAG: helix-turn-helix domain-containing protein [Sedimentibacter sp.]|uniref:PucR family transcriptional regulator n=1 Tax=Sedimentibacter sp. TaxID=1960295 RepID=UPI0031581C1A